MPQTISVVGLGYIGLPTSIALALSGYNVIGFDIVAHKTDAINRAEVGIAEPGLNEALKMALESGRFRATTRMQHAEAYIIAVPTPVGVDHKIDMSFILSAISSIAPVLSGGELIILESTSPPGTTELLAEHLVELRPELFTDNPPGSENANAIQFSHCPERILPGRAMEELRTNDRVIGGMSQEATKRSKKIYSSFCSGEFHETNLRTAEMAKLTENAFRDVNIAFANELSLICDELDMDVLELIDLANHHPRVNILDPGPGVGGHCIAVDPWFIVSSSPRHSNLIRTAREVNDAKPKWFISKIKEAISEAKVEALAILGLSYKADIGDIRASPAVQICAELADTFPGLRILAVEPNLQELPGELANRPNVRLCDFHPAIRDSDVIVLLVGHDEFKSLRKEHLEGKEVVDAIGFSEQYITN